MRLASRSVSQIKCVKLTEQNTAGQQSETSSVGIRPGAGAERSVDGRALRPPRFQKSESRSERTSAKQSKRSDENLQECCVTLIESADKKIKNKNKNVPCDTLKMHNLPHLHTRLRVGIELSASTAVHQPSGLQEAINFTPGVHLRTHVMLAKTSRR